VIIDEAGIEPESDSLSAHFVGGGRAAIAAEASALWELARGLDDRFALTVRMLMNTAGRVVVAGIGKSGHVARKIAATFTATGTPASFLHAGDALHGDIGELLPGDTVLLLSNSGETRECCAIAAHARALGLPVIAVTSRPDSALALTANLALPLPHAAEICPLQLSPTTSTTMMLALGDALAVVLMREREIAPERLRQLHPAGRIGRELVPVASLMRVGRDLPLVAAATPMREVMAVMCDKGLGIAIVADSDRQLIGVITDGDLRRNVDRLGVATAADILTPEPRHIRSDALARDALALLSACRITALVVLDSGTGESVAGLVHVHDFLSLGVS
jgi:arabinose-5-phosphate isomerase